MSPGCISEESGAPWALKRVACHRRRCSFGCVSEAGWGPAGRAQLGQGAGFRPAAVVLFSEEHETGKECGLAQVLCPTFPLPDQHWSDDGPSDAETELCRQHQAEVEAELLRVPENEEKQPPSTPWCHERGQSLSQESCSQDSCCEPHKGSGPGAAVYQPPGASPPCAQAARGFTHSPLCVLFGAMKVPYLKALDTDHTCAKSQHP